MLWQVVELPIEKVATAWFKWETLPNSDCSVRVFNDLDTLCSMFQIVSCKLLLWCKNAGGVQRSAYWDCQGPSPHPIWCCVWRKWWRILISSLKSAKVLLKLKGFVPPITFEFGDHHPQLMGRCILVLFCLVTKQSCLGLAHALTLWWSMHRWYIAMYQSRSPRYLALHCVWFCEPHLMFIKMWFSSQITWSTSLRFRTCCWPDWCNTVCCC